MKNLKLLNFLLSKVLKLFYDESLKIDFIVFVGTMVDLFLHHNLSTNCKCLNGTRTTILKKLLNRFSLKINIYTLFFKVKG